MTSEGTAHGRFVRAVQRRNLVAADAAARELGRLSLTDALALTALLAECDVRRFERAAVRWHGRFALEVKGLRLADSQLALAALAELRTPAADAGAAALAKLGRLYGLSGLELALGLE